MEKAYKLIRIQLKHAQVLLDQKEISEEQYLTVVQNLEKEFKSLSIKEDGNETLFNDLFDIID